MFMIPFVIGLALCGLSGIAAFVVIAVWLLDRISSPILRWFDIFWAVVEVASKRQRDRDRRDDARG